MNEKEKLLIAQAAEGKMEEIENFIWSTNKISRDFFEQAVSIGKQTRNGSLLSGLSESVKENCVEGGMDQKEYFRLSELASDFGDKNSSEQLGWDYLDLHNWGKAFHYFTKAIVQGVSNADLASEFGCHPLIPGDGSNPRMLTYDIGETYYLCPKNFPLDWWLFVLDRNPTPILEYLMGLWFWGGSESENKYWGENKSPDKAKAMGLFERSAAGGCPDAMLKLIDIFKQGEFKDHEKALKWFREIEAFGEGGENPFLESINICAQELGVTTKQVQAWEEKACDGDPVACVEAAIAYLFGEGAPKDVDKAFSFVEEAISNDFAEDGDIVDLDGNVVSSPLPRFIAAIREAPKAEQAELTKRLSACYLKHEREIKEMDDWSRRRNNSSKEAE